MRSRPARSVPVLLVLAAAALVAGCGGGTPPAPPPATPTPSPTPEVWTESVCAALVPVVARLTAAPGFDLGAPEATRQAYLTYLDEGLAVTDRARAELAAAGAAPVPDGDVIAEQVRGDVADLRMDLAEARDQVQRTDTGSTVAFGRALVGVTRVVGCIAQRRRGGRDDQPRPHARGRLRVVAVVRAAAAFGRARHRHRDPAAGRDGADAVTPRPTRTVSS